MGAAAVQTSPACDQEFKKIVCGRDRRQLEAVVRQDGDEVADFQSPQVLFTRQSDSDPKDR